jgi:molybdopterin converting factor small subunit
MSVLVELPGALEQYAGGRASLRLDAPGATIGSALRRLRADYPDVHDRVIDERGELRPHVNVFIDNENIRYLRGLDTPLDEKNTVFILPAVSGG